MPYNPRAVVDRAAAAYGANPDVLYHIGRRESGFRNVVNDWDSNAAAGTPSASWFQFIKPTFDSFSAHARKANPAAWEGVSNDWRDPMAQALTTAWAITNGKGGHWTTFKSALSDAGASNARGKAPQQPKSQPMPSYGLASAGPLVSAGLFDEGSFLGDYLKRRASDPVQTIQTAPVARAGATRSNPSAKGVPARRAGETGQQYLDRVLMGKFGLKHDPGNAQTTSGRHSPNSYHYRGGGQATDFGNALNTEEQLDAAKAYVDANSAALGIAESLDEGDHRHFATLRSMRGVKKR